MLLLALDTTSRVCSVALGDDQRLWAEYFLQTKNTHSQRLMPLIVSLLKDAGVDKNRLEGIAVNVGPGSFTGIRIGLATAQGFCRGLNIPVVGVMTLDALAEACTHFNGLICPMLDARKDQLYTALYRGGDKAGPLMLEPAAALSLEELYAQLHNYGDEEVIFLGDGLERFREELRKTLQDRFREMPYAARLNRAALVLQKGLKIWQEKGPLSSYALKPLYLRLPEAERKMREKN